MQKSKFLFLLSVFLILLFIIPSSFAADCGDIALGDAAESMADDGISEVSVEVDSNLGISDYFIRESSKLSDSSGNIRTNLSDVQYNDIKSAIDDNEGEFSIVLGEGTYSNAKSLDHDLASGESNTNLSIQKKNITFIGQGKDKTFIDGGSADWLFNITDSDVTFRDLSFINAVSASASVINSTESNLALINCTVENNAVVYSSINSYSPISFKGGYFTFPSLTIKDSSFIGNTAVNNGGVITVSHANANISDSIFINNSAKSEDVFYNGGAIYLMNNNRNVSFDNCIFINNSGRNGGSIGSYYGGNLSVYNSKFYNSTASENGGAIYSESLDSSSSKVYIYVSNNMFENCSAANLGNDIDVKGTVLVDLSSNAKISVNDTEIIAGTDRNLTVSILDNDGNPIEGQLEINLTSAKNNYSHLIDFTNGLAYLPLKDLPLGIYDVIYNLKSDDYTVLPVKSIIRVNTGYDYSLIMDPSNATLYEGESYTVHGYVIDAYGNSSNILNSMKIVIQWEDIDGMTHSLTGAYYIEDAEFTYDISNLELIPTNVYDIEFQVQNTDETISVENGHFYARYINKLPDNVIDLDVIYVDEIKGDDDSGSGEENNPIKTIQVALNINTILGGGKTIVLKKGNYEVSSFAIKDDVTVIGEDKERVIISQSSGHKGMFFINEGIDVEFNNISFTCGENTVVPYGSVFSNYYASRLVLNNSLFYNNSGWYGGVINNNDEGSILIIDNCSFWDNRARDAGAISASNGFVNITNSNFTNNQAQYLYQSNKTVNGTGGAINLYGYTEAYIDNCNFVNNQAPGVDLTVDSGGAIAISVIGNATIRNSNFTDNYAHEYGGAIWAVHGTIDIYGCIFINNTAGKEGSAVSIYFNDDTLVNLTNSVIIGDGSSNTHVVYATDDTLSLVYADNNWWGSNSRPRTSNIPIETMVVFALYNDENDNLCIALENNDSTEFNGYLPGRNVILTPADNFDNSLVELGNNVNSMVLNYSGDLTSDSISATMDKQTLYLNYRHYPVIATKINAENINGILNSTVSIIADVSANGAKLNSSTVSFYISNGDSYEYLGDADVIDGQAVLEYYLTELGTFDVQMIFNGDDTYKSSTANAKLTVTVQSLTNVIAEDSTIYVDDLYRIKLAEEDGSAIVNKELSIVVLDKSANAKLNLTENTDNKGFAYLNLSSGNYSLSISFKGDNNYLPSSASADLNVLRHSSSLTISQKDGTGEISILLTALNGSDSKISLSDKAVLISFVDGKGLRSNFELITDNQGLVKINLEKGNYMLLVNFIGDNKYSPCNVSLSLIVSEDASNGTDANGTDTNGTGGNGTDNNATGGNGTGAGGNGTDANATGGNGGTGGNESENITDKILCSDDLQKLIDNTEAGSALVLSNSTFENVSNIKINKDITIVGENASIISAGDGNPIFVISPVSEGLHDFEIAGIDFDLHNKDIVFSVNAENSSSPLSIETPCIKVSNNSFDSSDENFLGESVTVLALQSERGVLAPSNSIEIVNNTLLDGIRPFIFEVTAFSNSSAAVVPVGGNIPEKTETVLIYKDMTTYAVSTAVDGRIGSYFNVTLRDIDGNPLANKFVQIGFNGKIYNRTTNETGGVNLQINLAVKGTYTFAVSFLGDETYNGSFVVAKITVNLQNAKLTTQSKSYKASAKTKTLAATFKTKAGNLISGKKISFTVNGKTYSAKTNSKGVATVKVSLSTKKTYSFTAKFAGDTMYASTSVKGTVKII